MKGLGLIRTVVTLGLSAFAPALAADKKPPPPPAPTVITGATLQGLDKTTARITRIEAPLGQVVRFGTLRITVSTCRRHPPEDTPEAAAFLDITDQPPGQTEPSPVFKGWMFASSPSISAMEHPVYDVWVQDCSTATGSTPPKG